jgi:type IV secretion system protein VirB6
MASAAPAPANDHGGGITGRRETRIVGGAPGHSAPTSTQFLSRARGVGSRFRAAPARHSEKLK